MALLSLDSLYHVSAYLNHRDLCNFCLVNRQCHDFSRKHLYSSITIDFSSPESLSSAVNTWHSILQRTQSFQYVQHVKVLANTLYQHPTAQTFIDCGDNPAEPWKYCFVGMRDRIPVHGDSEWEELSCLIKKLPTLQEVTWGCKEQIPASILRYINHDRPTLRLHMRNFVLRCLFRPAAEPIVLDPYEIELATSPCLYSVSVEYDYLEDSYANYHEYAITDMLAGATPSLREINLFWRSGGNSPWLVQALRGPRHRYQRGSISGTSSPGLGSLKSLNIVSNDSARALRQWSSVTDFSSLESLTVHYHLEDEALLWLSSCRLSSLRHLSLSVDYGDPDTETTEAVETLITSLPSLDSFKLPGPLDLDMLLPVFDHCGHRLRRLLLSCSEKQPTAANLASLGFILALQKTCPQVEELALCIMRSQGDANEVAIYHALGGFRHVRKMHLAVYCPQPFSARFESIVEFEDFYTGMQVADEDTRVVLDNTLINFAFDETLARSIFRTISM